MTGPLLLPVLSSKHLRAWPKHTEGGAIGYQLAPIALRARYATDAHTAGYSAPSIERRLDKNAAEQMPGGVAMVALFVDVDGAEHKADPAWRAAESSKIAAAFAALPGGFCYQTRGGYRLVWRLAAPVIITGPDDAQRWRLHYWRTLLALSRRFGLEGDPACADWTRLYRLPHATRDEGGKPEDLPTEGDPELRQPLALDIEAADLAADLAEARRLEAAHPAVKDERGKTTTAAPWSAAVKALAFEAGEREPEGGASLPLEEARPVDGPAAEPPPRASGPRPSSKASGPRVTREDRERLWAEKALERMAGELAATTRGGRNNAARDAALVLGHYASHLLDPTAIERTLLAACERNGMVRDDGRDAALTTIRHAISDGMKTPKRPNVSADRTRDPEAWREAFRKARGAQQPPTDEGAPMPAEQEHDQADEGQDPSPSEAPPSWRAELQQDRSGYRKNLANVALILSRSPEWSGCLAYDEFADKIALLRCPPSHAHMASERFPRAWEDADDVHTARWLQTEWKIDAGPDLVGQAIVAVAREQRIHPVRDYLDGLTWDGTPRLELWLTTYLGARETIYSRTVGPMMLRAAVARVLFPGCKVDTMLVLQGLQDLGKSTAIKILCGEEWFTDELADFGSKDAAMQLLGVWLIEVSEMDSYGRAGVERVKGFVSRTTDRYRAAYGRHVRKQPRQCVFFGTTNADTYLRDETGNRRFWPVLCGAVGGVDLAGLARDRDQLWAEASAQVNAGLRWHLDRVKDAEALKMAKAAQGAVQERDAWENVVASYLADKDRVFVEMILSEALGLGVERWGRPEQMRVAAILKRAGWTRHHLTSESGARVWGYLAPYPSSPQPPGDVPTSPAPEVGSGGLDQNPQPGEATGTNRTEGANGSLRVPGENAGNSTLSLTEEDSRHSAVQVSETVGTVGTVGTESQNSGPKADPTSLIEVGTVGTSTPLGELIRVLQEAPYVSLPFQVAQAEAERRLSPLSHRALPPGTDRTALEAAYQEARARSERDRGPTPTPPPASGVKASAANDPAPDPPTDLAAGDEEGWEPLE